MSTRIDLRGLCVVCRWFCCVWDKIWSMLVHRVKLLITVSWWALLACILTLSRDHIALYTCTARYLDLLCSILAVVAAISSGDTNHYLRVLELVAHLALNHACCVSHMFGGLGSLWLICHCWWSLGRSCAVCGPSWVHLRFHLLRQHRGIDPVGVLLDVWRL